MCQNDEYDHEGNYDKYPCPLLKRKCCFKVESMGFDICWPQKVEECYTDEV